MASRVVLLEAERNIRGKLGKNSLLRFYQKIAALDLELGEAPSPQEVATHSRIIDHQDAHVLAAALKGGVELLLTLDRNRFFSRPVLQADLPFRIMAPRDFLRRMLGT